MFTANKCVNVHIIVNGTRIAVPGITMSDEFTADRVNRNTGRAIPTQYVEVISYHDVPADQSRTGEPRKYWKVQRQSAAFLTLRSHAVPELDDHTGQELLDLAAKSLAEIQYATTTAAPAGTTGINELRPKSDFGKPVALPLEATA